MAKLTAPNRFKEYHEFLKVNDNEIFQQRIKEVCSELGIHSTTFYRKLEKPAARLSISEKKAIAGVYKLPLHFLFPEMEELN